jgi:hypothetical protein
LKLGTHINWEQTWKLEFWKRKAFMNSNRKATSNWKYSFNKWNFFM